MQAGAVPEAKGRTVVRGCESLGLVCGMLTPMHTDGDGATAQGCLLTVAPGYRCLLIGELYLGSKARV